MRIRNNPNAHKELVDSGYLIKKYPLLLNNNIVVELGMGKGEMLTKLAFENPQKTYVGVEKFATIAAIAAKKAKEYDLNNFFIINNDISELENLFIGNTNEIWLTFSDPWPKARHEKRRLTHHAFLDRYKKILSNKGVLKFKTDNDKLFSYSIDSFSNNGWKLKKVTTDFHGEKFSKDNVMTGYEEKWSSKGKNINYLEARK